MKKQKIEKLEVNAEMRIIARYKNFNIRPEDIFEAYDKINELVEAVNTLQAKSKNDKK